MRVNWSSVGDWFIIFFFCISCALIADIQSRLFHPVEGSMALERRAWILREIDRINREEQYDNCKEKAKSSNMEGVAFVWYYDKSNYEYWCGFVVLDTVSEERLMELKPHIEVLNTTRRVKNETDRNKGRSSNISKTSER